MCCILHTGNRSQAFILPGTATLTTLHIHDTSVGLPALESTLPQLTNLVDLTLRATLYGRASPTRQNSFLSSLQLPTLMRLDLCWNDEHFKLDGAASSLAASLPHLSGLTHLSLSHNNLTDCGVSALASSLSHLVCLKHLGLGNNGIMLKCNSVPAAWVIQLASSLGSMTHLETLDLSSNRRRGDRLDAIGFSAVLESIRGHAFLKRIDLSDCGWAALEDWIQPHHSIVLEQSMEIDSD